MTKSWKSVGIILAMDEKESSRYRMMYGKVLSAAERDAIEADMKDWQPAIEPPAEVMLFPGYLLRSGKLGADLQRFDFWPCAHEDNQPYIPKAAAVPPTGTVDEAWTALRRKNYARSIELALPLAISGEAQAQYLFAWMLEKGLGMRMDKCVAAVWYDRAARQGHALSQAGLARAYADGTGVAKNRDLAYRWQLTAERNGYTSEHDRLADIGWKMTAAERKAIEASTDSGWEHRQYHADFQLIPDFVWDNVFSLDLDDRTAELGKRVELGRCGP